MDELPETLWTRPTVLLAVEHLFASDLRAKVLAELDRIKDDVAGGPAGRARLQLAVLTLADGDSEALRHWTDVIFHDWRDVLCAAYYFDQTSADPRIRWSLAERIPELGSK